MTTRVGIGLSQNKDIPFAVKQAATQAKEQIGSKDIDLVIIFATSQYNPKEMLPTAREVLSPKRLIGCSTVGIIHPQLLQIQGLVILAISSNDIHVGVSSVIHSVSEDTRQLGANLANEAIHNLTGHVRKAFLFFSDSLLEDPSSMLKGLQEVLGNVFPIIGVLNHDGVSLKNSFQFYQDKFTSHSTVGLLIGGHANVGISCRHGLIPLGKPRYVTSVNKNIIKTIDNKRASHIYEEFLGINLKDLLSPQLANTITLYPLGTQHTEENFYFLRNAVKILEDGSIVCQGGIPLGAEIHIMLGNKEACHQSALEAAHEAKNNLVNKNPKLILVFESIARYKLLGRNAYKEIQMIQNIFGESIPVVGLYSFGEIAPFQLKTQNFKKNFLQNGSILVVAIG